jgi:hypothetical protein
LGEATVAGAFVGTASWRFGGFDGHSWVPWWG